MTPFDGDPHADHGCTCLAVSHADAAQHDGDCIGSDPRGWRARLPEFLRPEVEAIWRRDPITTPLFRALATSVMHEARYGPFTVTPQPQAPQAVRRAL